MCATLTWTWQRPSPSFQETLASNQRKKDSFCSGGKEGGQWFSHTKREEKAQIIRLPVPARRSQSPSGCAAFLQGKLPILKDVLCLPQGHETTVLTGPVVQVPLSRANLPSVSQHMPLSRMLNDALSSKVPDSDEARLGLNGASPDLLSSPNCGSSHLLHIGDSTLVRSVSPSSGSVSLAAASLPAAFPAAGVAAAAGSSLGGWVGGGWEVGGRWEGREREEQGRWAVSLLFFTHEVYA